jgi:hypothetical protein
VLAAGDANGPTQKTANTYKKFKRETRISKLGERKIPFKRLVKLSKTSKDQSQSKHFKLELAAR